ncbi:large polymerase protein [avian paramyxovirus 13]|uniref:RNA-directed RNA polymerase L n=1 Tax=avian paramyxovirus 13 TaxID=2560321 RepID=A0A173M8X2_9MONO|nr:large polymerase protein [Avian paramyxovirus goose/Shimane/67/2000]BAV03985.1 large polymerase protein [Avian paramyxovirus goose/Shimane/67/2000]
MLPSTSLRGQNNLILPESHLSSPIVKHKLLYYWRITGLQLPESCMYDNLILTREWKNIMESNRGDVIRAKKIGSKTHSYLNHKKAISPLIHPSTLSWLTALRCEVSEDKMAQIEKKVSRHFQIFGMRFSKLSDMIEGKIYGHHVSRERTEEFAFLQNHPGMWFHTQWSCARNTWLHVKQLQRHLILKSRANKQNDLILDLTVSDGHLIISSELVVVIQTSTNAFTCLTPEMVLMYSDLLEGRNLVQMLCSAIPFFHPLFEKIELLLRLIDELATVIGGDVYEVVAILEAMSYATVQLFEPTERFAGDFFSFNLTEIKNVLKDKISTELTNRMISAIAEIYSGLNANLGAEMLCILRLWGHPLLTASVAAKAVRTQMCAAKIIDFDIQMQVLAFFKGTIINGFRKKNSGLWPKILPESILSPVLDRLYKDAAEISHQIMLKEYKSLALIDFKPCIDFDPVSDLSMFLKDKAIARPAKEWLCSFKRDLLYKKDAQKLTGSTRSNRLLIEFLEAAEFDPYQELQYLNSMAYLGDDDVSVSYSLKEKEVKINGRIFAKLTKTLRNCQVMAEGILAAEIAPFFQGNGVIQDSISLSKSMLAMSQMSYNCNKERLENTKKRIHRYRAGEGSKQDKIRMATFITTDLSKYCLNWRYQTIKPFARALNQLLGFDHFFEWIHLRLMNTTMFVGDPYNPPAEIVSGDINDQPNDDIFIVSARGGIEGLCQKLWSMISIAAINLAAARSSCRVACMVQGDNQVIASTKEIKPSDNPDDALEELQKLSDRFFEELVKINHGIGHNLKMRETVRSNTFFVYSKRIFKDGKILSQMLKNAAKLTLISGDLGEDTGGSASDISGTIARICENGAGKDFCYLLNYYMLLIQFYFDCDFSILDRGRQDIRQTMSGNIEAVHNYIMTPSQVGGLNGLQYVRLYNRNIGDPGTTALAEIKRLTTVGLLSPRILPNLLTRQPGSGTWATLCNDPYAFNFDTVGSPGILLKKHTQRVLFESCANPLLAGVHREDADAEELSLAKYLLDQEFIHPRVGHVIMQASSIGRRKQIQGLLDTTNTIVKYALDKKPLGVRRTEKIINYSVIHFQLFLDELWDAHRHYPHLLSQDMCSLALAEYCRNKSWSSITGGRPILGVANPDTLELATGCIVSIGGTCHLCDAGDSQYTWFHLPDNINLIDGATGNPAIRVPFLGSRTQERRVASMAKLRNLSPHAKAALRGASVLIWAFGDNDTNWNAALEIANSRCNIDLEHLKILSPLPTAGNLQHRLDDGISQVTFTPASLYRVSPYVQISNDSQRLVIDDSIKESNLIYQQLMLLGLAAIEAIFPLTCDHIVDSMTLHLHSAHSCCIREASLAFPIELAGVIPQIRAEVTNRFMYDGTPISLDDMPTMDMLVFKNYELSLDQYTTFELMGILAMTTGKLIGQSIISYDDETSIKNDAIIVYDNSRNWISEFQNCDAIKLLEYVAVEVLLDCAYQIYYLRVIGVENIMLYMSDLLQSMPGILLANLAATISHPGIFGRLYRVGLLELSGVHQLASVDFISLAAQVLTKSMRRVLTAIAHGEIPTLTFPSIIEETLNEKMLQLIARLCCLVTVVHAKTKQIPKIRDLSAEDKCRVLTEFMNSQTTPVLNQHLDMNKLMTPKLVTFPANLYYISRKSLNLIREREDKDCILQTIFPIEIGEQRQLPANVGSFTKDPFYQESTAFILEVPIENEVTYNKVDLCNVERREAGLIGSPSSSDLRRYLFRGIGNSSSSWYKVGQIFSIPEVRQTKGGVSLFLGEGSGSIMAVCELHIPHRIIYYNTMFDNAMNPPQRHYGPSPAQFFESVVYQNMQAGVPCQLGFVQEFTTLWREVSAETDLTREECVTYITSTVGCQTTQFIMVDAEIPKDSALSIIEQFITNILTISYFVLSQNGVLVIKTLYSQCRQFNLLVTNLMLSCSKLYILSNGYMCRGDYECFLIAIFSNPVPFSSADRIMQTSKNLIRKGGSIMKPEVHKKIIDAFIKQEREVISIINSPTEVLIKFLSDNIDQALLAAGGRPARPNGTDYNMTMVRDDIEFKDIIVQHIDTVLKSIVYFSDEDCLADTVFLLTPYNLSNRGKSITMLKQCVTQLVEQIIIRLSVDDLYSIDSWITKIIGGVLCLNDVMHWKEYLRRSHCKKYLRHRMGAGQVKEIFCHESVITLHRAAQKLYMKIIGNSIKGYN